MRIGLNAKLYFNTGTYEAKTWSVYGNVKDLALNIEKGEWDATIREGGGWAALLGTIKTAAVEFRSIWKAKAADTTLDALIAAFHADTVLEFAVLDGDINIDGAVGLRAEFEVFKASRAEPLGEGIAYDFVLKPTAKATGNPGWVTSGTSSV